jgi:hypothetical protein
MHTYDLAQNRWTTLEASADLKSVCNAMSVPSWCGTPVYVDPAGESRQVDPITHYWISVPELVRFDPIAERWIRVALLPLEMRPPDLPATAVTDDGVLYLVAPHRDTSTVTIERVELSG